jgi:hypothetical protein
MSNEARLDYLLECFRSAREELITRIRQRTELFRLQLIAQGIIVALAGGLSLESISVTGPLPDVVALAIPVSFTIATPYGSLMNCGVRCKTV